MDQLSLTPEETAFLGDVTDDVYGLWEVDWFFNGYRPQWSSAQRVAVVKRLISLHLINVFFGEMAENLSPLPTDQALDAVGKWGNWQPREYLREPVHHVMTNNAGISVLRAKTARN